MPSADSWTLHGNLTRDAYDAWHSLAARQGVTLSSLLESIGLHARMVENLNEFSVIVSDAQRIMADRKKRT